MDTLDLKILNLIQADGRVTQSGIARQVGLAPSAVLERLRKLEAGGVIRGYAALIDPLAAELSLLAFVAVRTTDLKGDESAGEQLAAIPEALEVHNVAGDDGFLLKVRARDTADLADILRRRLSDIPGIASTRTTIVLETLKETPRLNLGTTP